MSLLAIRNPIPRQISDVLEHGRELADANAYPDRCKGCYGNLGVMLFEEGQKVPREEFLPIVLGAASQLATEFADVEEMRSLFDRFLLPRPQRRVVESGRAAEESAQSIMVALVPRGGSFYRVGFRAWGGLAKLATAP